MNKKAKIAVYAASVALLFAIALYVYGVAQWGLPYPCSEYNFHNSTLCVHCYSYNFKCVCQQFELYQDIQDGYYDCNTCPPYKVGDLWPWLNCGNMTNEFTKG